MGWCFVKHRTTKRGITQWYSAGLRAGCSGVRVPEGGGNFSPHHRVQIGPGAYPASYPRVTRGSFTGGKAAGAWSEVKNAWSYNSTPQYAFMAWCLVKKSTGTTLPLLLRLAMLRLYVFCSKYDRPWDTFPHVCLENAPSFGIPRFISITDLLRRSERSNWIWNEVE
jgi:hypothetical protein